MQAAFASPDDVRNGEEAGGVAGTSGHESQHEESEAYHELCDIAHKRVGHVPAAFLARHMLTVTTGSDWPTRRAAMEAVLRRWSFASRDGLRVTQAPPKRRCRGTYTTGRKRKSRQSTARPYISEIHCLDPLRASCSCPDFLRNALGLCKHVLVALDHAFASGHASDPVSAHEELAESTHIRIAWDPVRPLSGRGDWLGGVYWSQGPNAVLNAGKRARNLFEPGAGRCFLKNTFSDEPQRRLRLVSALRKAIHSMSWLDCDVALRHRLEEEYAELERCVKARLSNSVLSQHLRSLEKQLYPYQRTGVQRFLSTGRLLLADDMGLGKTAQAIAACHVLWRARKVQRGLLIVPASLKSQWKREWNVFTNTPVEIVDGSPNERRAIYDRFKKGFLITNYEQVLRDIHLIKAWDPDIAVLDEAQRIKNWATKTAATVKQIDARYRLVLTGTPLENRLDELASILEWIDPYALEPAWRLGPWHTVWIDGQRDSGGARNLDTLRARMSHCMLRRVRKEVLDQLPPRTDTQVTTSLTPSQSQEHAVIDNLVGSLVSRARKRPLTQAEFLRLMQYLTQQRLICNGMALFQFKEVWAGLEQVQQPSEELISGLSSPKLLELRALMASLLEDPARKIVVFSQWRRMLQLSSWAIAPVLAAAGAKALMFSGQESQRRRTQNVIDFHDDPRARILFATDAGGVGLNLQRAASCCINLDLPWNPAVLEQRIGRIYRLGQGAPVEVYNLVAEDGIESRIAGIVDNKQKLFSGLFDGTSDEVTFEAAGSFVARLEGIVEPQAMPETSDDEEDHEDEIYSRDELSSEPPEIGASDMEPARNGDMTSTERSGDRLSASPRGAKMNAEEPEATAAADPALRSATGPAAGDLPTPALSLGEAAAEIRIERNSDGRIALSAPPEAAPLLASVFQAMADQLAACAPDAARPPRAPATGSN